ncbi:MAG: ion transporter [Alkalimonas sp.]|uniref:Ion transporter n=1 Tax=Alkalimonas delamerensis TaxID=265981 RepID=A0ABT9GKZ1_9GAMM|nr:ion transporter [Alkalimonas delamerensis]MCC5851345.1 ion transporter [Alkalimonas sp.]MDP4527641.1 ion transporter [Alkalimonas delamerensis]
MQMDATWSQRLKEIEQSRAFQGFVIAVIVIAALAVGAKTYRLPAWLEQSIGLLDVAITLFFLIEISIRFLSAEQKARFFHNGWNLFDTLIVLASLVPLPDSEMVVIGRLLRVLRVLRLVSIVPELRFLINALLKAIPKMGYIALLMFIIFYIFAAIGSIFFADIDEFLWGDIAISMLTLFRVATFEDWTDVMYDTMAVYPLSWIYYLVFIFLTTFIFLNMMVGVILEIMTNETRKEDHQQQEDHHTELLQQLAMLQQQVTQLNQRLTQQQDTAGKAGEG